MNQRFIYKLTGVVVTAAMLLTSCTSATPLAADAGSGAANAPRPAAVREESQAAPAAQSTAADITPAQPLALDDGFGLAEAVVPLATDGGQDTDISQSMDEVQAEENSQIAAESAASGNKGSGSLAIPTTFTLTRPVEKLTTTYASYFITGTSDPEKPVYFGENEITRLGTKGTFGVHVRLAMGSNTFHFTQDGTTKSVTITRKAATGTPNLKDITQDSMVPAVMSGVKVGQELRVGCVAPAGAEVTATFDGTTVTLKQAKTDLNPGRPASFTGSILVDGSYDADVTAAAGKVTYAMKYGGGTKSYKSTGQVYVAGSDSRIAVEVTSYVGFVYPDTSNLSLFKEKVKAGARDYIQNQNNVYFELSSGGFIPKSMVKIVEGKVSVKNKLSDVSSSVKGKSEVYTFVGTGSPTYTTKIADNTFSLTLYNTSGNPKADVSGSRMASSSSVSEGESSVTYKFPLKSLLWGYDVAFDGVNTLLTFKYKPSLSTSGQPFEGLTVVLDPGHGGTDSGALGLAGTTGPTEDDVNLANALATKDLLTEMGAKVIMTRSKDAYLSLDDRLKMIETSKADMFISIHHNSIGENIDANKVAGMEIYYHTALSKKFADGMMTSLSTGLSRNNRLTNRSYYRVTLMSYSPALLLELGFMSNPVEYERSTSQAEMKRVASAIADGITRTLQ